MHARCWLCNATPPLPLAGKTCVRACTTSLYCTASKLLLSNWDIQAAHLRLPGSGACIQYHRLTAE